MSVAADFFFPDKRPTAPALASIITFFIMKKKTNFSQPQLERQASANRIGCRHAGGVCFVECSPSSSHSSIFILFAE